jgi:protein-S-isoprenylcysteine O-methyltransferase Ste14
MQIPVWIPLTAIVLLFCIVGRLLQSRALFRIKAMQWAHHHKAQVKDEARWVWIMTFLLTVGVGIGEYFKAGNPIMSAEYGAMKIIGLAVLALGLNVWLNAMAARKQFFWIIQVLGPKEELPPYSTNGIYARIRNPREWGLLLVIAGLAAALSLKFTLMFVILLFFASVYRVSSRDRVLIEKYGREYTSYMNKSKKLIPYIY